MYFFTCQNKQRPEMLKRRTWRHSHSNSHSSNSDIFITLNKLYFQIMFVLPVTCSQCSVGRYMDILQSLIVNLGMLWGGISPRPHNLCFAILSWNYICNLWKGARPIWRPIQPFHSQVSRWTAYPSELCSCSLLKKILFILSSLYHCCFCLGIFHRLWWAKNDRLN